MAKCNSCNYEGDNVTIFECAKCENSIVRCSKCKSLSIEYDCSKCGFRGP